jgi:hypothetical protein
MSQNEKCYTLFLLIISCSTYFEKLAKKIRPYSIFKYNLYSGSFVYT